MTDPWTARPSRRSATRAGLLAWGVMLVGLTLAVALACSLVGPYPVLGAEGSLWTNQIWQTRLVRLAAAAVVGAALAVGGVALQGLLRNPLAEPYILGISSGAGVGVLLGMALAGWYNLPEYLSTPVLAFVGAVVTCGVVYLIAQRRGRLDPYTLILSGVIVNAFNGAIMLTIHLYVDPFRIAEFVRWGMGDVPDSLSLNRLGVGGGFVLLASGLLLLRAYALNTLGLGDDVAASAGVSVQRLRVEAFVLVGLMTAAAVSLAGPVGFVGLIVPHICRLLLGPDHRLLTVAGAFVGAMFLMAAHALCQVAGPWIGAASVPIGIVTSLCGGPFFIYLLRKRGAEAGW
ncbi:MAG: FecCD family ABC transporter permease [Phycisphaerae bacterium]